MESAAASATMDLLIGKIASVIQTGIPMIESLPDQLGEFKQELIFMRSFLEDAREKKGSLTNMEMSWVKSIRDKSMEVEVVMDEYLYYNTKQLSRNKFLRQTVCLPMNLRESRRIAMKLHKIKTDIIHVREAAQRYGTDRIQGSTSNIGDDNNNTWLQNHAESSRFFKDEDLVGIDDDKEKILRWLTGGEPHQEIMSVVGMGGAGKTTLVASVYRSQDVQRQFDCYAWITISQKYTVEELLRRMIKEFYSAVKNIIPVNLGNMVYTELVSLLVNFLGAKRYVIVLDDVWSINLWDDIKVSLPNNCCGSRVLLTTRQEDIATCSFGVRSHLYNVKPLEMNESMTLFCMKAFSRNHDNSCPPELLILAQTLVEKCRGLPLAIVSLGGAMSSKKLESEWRRVNDSLDFELKNNPALDRMKCILLLSYHSLPYHLKRCFLYCCLFPEDYEIQGGRLKTLWMAEGFVEKERGMTPEEVADSYLMELVRRNTLQDVRRYSTGPTSSRFKMHDLIREVGLSVSRTENFCDIYYGQELASDKDNDSKTRLWSIQTNNQKGLESWMKTMTPLRSILIFASGNISPLLKKITSSSCCRLLRVLHLKNMELEYLPSEVGELFNLRYLNLSGTKVKELPKSIGRLQNLQTLDLSYTQIKVLPIGISKLENLRHLESYNSVSWEDNLDGGFHPCYVPQTPSTIYKLQNLQILNGVEAEVEFMKHVRKMTQLTRLVITKVRVTNEEDLCIAIQSLNLLRRLLLVAIDEDEYLPTMDAVSLAPSCLNDLGLYGKLETIPQWFPESLTRLSLEWCGLTEDPLPYIQHLPNLAWLLLNKAYIGKELHLRAGFQKLIDLCFINFSQLEEIKIEKGVMPGLKNLCLWTLTMLKTLPLGIEHLSNLEILNLAEVSNELVERIRGEDSVDRYQVRHIPQIKHKYRSPSGSKWFYESLS